MKLRVRLLLAITGPLVLVVLAISLLTARTTSDSMLAQMEGDGVVIAQLLSQSASFAAKVPGRVDSVLGDQMVTEARTTAQLVAVAEGRAGMSPEEINTILKDITTHTVLSEFWITDEKGHVYLTNTGQDFTFSPDASEQSQASVFYKLLKQKDGVVVQEASPRTLDSHLFKYVGVSGLDKPRIVQVGYDANVLAQLTADLNAQKLVDDLTGQGNVAAIRLMDGRGQPVAASSSPKTEIGQTVSNDDRHLIDRALSDRQVRSALQGALLKVAAPVVDQSSGQPQMVALIYLATDDVQQAIQALLLRTLIISLMAIVAGVLVSFLFSRSITNPIATLTDAASALEAGGSFDPEKLAGLAKNKNEVGQMARVFARMASEVQSREARLKDQVAQLKIEIDEAKKTRQVQEITETDYFLKLRNRAQELRARKYE